MTTRPIISADDARNHLIRIRDALASVRDSADALGASTINFDSFGHPRLTVAGHRVHLDAESPYDHPSLGHVAVLVDGAIFHAPPSPASLLRRLQQQRDALDAEIATLGGAS